MAIILGIDPGSRKTGFGIIEFNQGKSRYVTSGVIRLVDRAIPARLKVLSESLEELIQCYSPSELSIEQVFLARSADAALKLGHARGAAIVACVTRGMSVNEYSARQIKQSVVGSGGADKTQVQHMVSRLLSLPGVPAEDAADALAAALCHAHTQSSMIHIAGATSVARKRLR
jgi:crossover junction endodeoxyribonuclease RuvC